MTPTQYALECSAMLPICLAAVGLPCAINALWELFVRGERL